MRGFWGVRIATFRHRLKSEGLTLRLYRLKDLTVLSSLFTPEIFLEAGGLEFRVTSRLGFHKWLKTTFQVVYVIEVEEKDGQRIVGFAGLYYMKIGKSSWLSLTIFDPKDRRRGYGARAVELLCRHLRENGNAESVYAEVSRTNRPALSLLGKLGFETYDPQTRSAGSAVLARQHPPFFPCGKGTGREERPVFILTKSLG